MSSLIEMYRNPLFRGTPEGCNRSSTEVNRSCGDSVSLHLRVSPEGVLEELGFGGEGCSLSQSSAELVCRLGKGLDCDQAVQLSRSFIDFLSSDSDEPITPNLPPEFLYYDDLRKYPMRQGCALMAWEILEKLCVAQG